MIDVSVVKAMCDCTIKDGIMHIPISISPDDVYSVQHAVRNAILEALVPMYKPIKFNLYGIPLSTMVDFKSDLNKCLLDMLTPLHEAICYPTKDILSKTTVSWDLNQVIDRGPNKADFSTPNVTGVEAFNVGMDNMFTAYSRSMDSVYVNDLHPHIVKDELPTDRMEDYGLRPLLLDSEDIFKIKPNSGTSPQCHTIWALAAQLIDYHDIEWSTNSLKKYGIAIKQNYSLTPYLVPAIIKNSDSNIIFTYKRKIDEEVLTIIMREFAKYLLNASSDSSSDRYYDFEEFIHSYHSRCIMEDLEI